MLIPEQVHYLLVEVSLLLRPLLPPEVDDGGAVVERAVPVRLPLHAVAPLRDLLASAVCNSECKCYLPA